MQLKSDPSFRAVVPNVGSSRGSQPPVAIIRPSQHSQWPGLMRPEAPQVGKAMSIAKFYLAMRRERDTPSKQP